MIAPMKTTPINLAKNPPASSAFTTFINKTVISLKNIVIKTITIGSN